MNEGSLQSVAQWRGQWLVRWLRQRIGRLVWLLFALTLIASDLIEFYLAQGRAASSVLGVFSLSIAYQLSHPSYAWILARIFFYAFSISLFLIFCFTLWRLTGPRLPQSKSLLRALFALQIVIGVIMMSELTYLIAVLFAALLGLKSAWKWLILLLSCIISVKLIYFFYFPYIGHTKQLTGDLFFLVLEHLIAFAVGYMAMLEQHTRAKLQVSHTELLAAQVLLNESLRLAERNRIASNLHDVMGHHLSALHLQLDLALRQVDERVSESAKTALITSQSLASALLLKVRIFVHSESLDSQINLRHALETLCKGIPAPTIRLAFDEQLEIDDVQLAYTLFCSIQEAMTNTVRHAKASSLVIDLARHEQGVRVMIVDDGQGMKTASEGNGLRGMRERLEQLGGQLIVRCGVHRGVGLEMYIPLNLDSSVDRYESSGKLYGH